MLSSLARKPSLPRLLLILRPFSSPPIPTDSTTTIASSSDTASTALLPPLSALRGGLYPSATADIDSPPPHNLPLCPGCGVHLHSHSPSLPGFFSPPSPKSPDYKPPLDRRHPLDPLSLKSGAPIVDDPNPQNPNPKPKLLVCARCHSLRHYGRVKDPSAENLLPDFDFDKMIAPKIISPTGPRSVVLLVVDLADFDGSFPKRVAKIVSSAVEKNYMAWKEGKPGNVPRVLLVVTKIDLIPSSVSPEMLEGWVRNRARAGGVNCRLAGVHMVSAVKNWGVRNLVEHVRELVGGRGNVWAVGAQNAGKSTLINSMGKCVGGDGVICLTEAPVPGTTLGIVRVEGVLEGNAKLFDTPGILHPYQITTRLTRDEQRLIHMSKELRPRTYRIRAGHSVHIGGLMRLDLEESSVDSVYHTIWASPLVPLHMGKTENASTMVEEHFGRQLQPPIDVNRINELGKWERKEFQISGSSWDANSVDIAAAGLGWCSIGLNGDAVLGVWTYDGIDVVQRTALIPDRAKFFEEAGFTVSKIVSQADSKINKLKNSKSDKKNINGKVKSCNVPSVVTDAALCS